MYIWKRILLKVGNPTRYYFVKMVLKIPQLSLKGFIFCQTLWGPICFASQEEPQGGRHREKKIEKNLMLLPDRWEEKYVPWVTILGLIYFPLEIFQPSWCRKEDLTTKVRCIQWPYPFTQLCIFYQFGTISRCHLSPLTCGFCKTLLQAQLFEAFTTASARVPLFSAYS